MNPQKNGARPEQKAELRGNKRRVREIVRSINTDDSDRLICEGRNGYFIPRSAEEIERFRDELQRESRSRIEAARAEVQVISAKAARRLRSLIADAGSGNPNSRSQESDHCTNSQLPAAPERFEPEYIFLKSGEVLEQGDEFSPDGGKTWMGTHFACDPVPLFDQWKYRRRVDPGEGYRLLKFGEIVEPGDEFLTPGYTLEQSSDGDVSYSAPENPRTRYRRKAATLCSFNAVRY